MAGTLVPAETWEGAGRGPGRLHPTVAEISISRERRAGLEMEHNMVYSLQSTLLYYWDYYQAQTGCSYLFISPFPTPWPGLAWPLISDTNYTLSDVSHTFLSIQAAGCQEELYINMSDHHHAKC